MEHIEPYNGENDEHKEPLEHFSPEDIPQPERFDAASVGPQTEEQAEELRKAIEEARKD